MSDAFGFPDPGAALRSMLDIERNSREDAKRLAGRYDAQEVFDFLIKRVREFEADLKQDEEIGLQLANFGVASQLHIRAIGYFNPNLVEFRGVNSDGHVVALVQHISQLSFLLIAVKPIKEEPYRIGFR